MKKIKSFFIFFGSYLKILMKKLTGHHITADFKTKIERGVQLRTAGKESIITFGRYTSIRRNSEIFADGGKISFESKIFVNRNAVIVSHKEISIGAGTTIGPNVLIYDHDHNRQGEGFLSEPIKIGRNVWIGAGAIILKGVSIGDNSVVGAGSLVTRDVPAYSTYIDKRTPIVIGAKE